MDWEAMIENAKSDFRLKASSMGKKDNDINLAIASFSSNKDFLPSVLKTQVTESLARNVAKVVVSSYMQDNLKFSRIATEYFNEIGLVAEDLKPNSDKWGQRYDDIMAAISIAYAEYMATNLYDRFSINELTFGMSMARELGYDIYDSGSFGPGLNFNNISGDTAFRSGKLYMTLSLGPNQAQPGWIRETIANFKNDNSAGLNNGYNHLLYAFTPPVVHEMLFDRYILRNRRAKFIGPVDRSAGRTTPMDQVRVANAYYSAIFTVMPQAYTNKWKVNHKRLIGGTSEVLSHGFNQEVEGDAYRTVALGPELNGNQFPQRKSLSADEVTTNLKSRLAFLSTENSMTDQLAKYYLVRSSSLVMSKGMRVNKAQSRQYPLVLSVDYGDLFSNIEWT